MMKEIVKGYKGFDQDLKCNGYAYKLGETFETDKVKLCNYGFHFCENPLDVFGYYTPGTSRFAEVEASGDIEKATDDSKVVCSKLHVKAELSLHSMIGFGVKFILDRVDFKNAKESNTGYQSAATNTGDRSAATNTGNQSAATVEGKQSIASGFGIENKCSGAIGCWLVLTEWKQNKEYEWQIKEVKAIKVDGKKIKAGVFYMLKNGKVVVAK